MISEFFDHMLNNLERVTFTCSFPEFLNDMKSADSKLELVHSNTLKEIKFIYKHNIVTKSIAVIFVNTYLFGDNKKFVAKGEKASLLFKSVLKFMIVRSY